MEKLVTFKSDYFCDEMSDGDDKLAEICIDGFPKDEDKEGEVVAKVILTKGGEIVTAYNNNGYRENKKVNEHIASARIQLTNYFSDYVNKKDADARINLAKKAGEVLSDKLMRLLGVYQAENAGGDQIRVNVLLAGTEIKDAWSPVNISAEELYSEISKTIFDEYDVESLCLTEIIARTNQIVETGYVCNDGRRIIRLSDAAIRTLSEFINAVVSECRFAMNYPYDSQENMPETTFDCKPYILDTPSSKNYNDVGVCEKCGSGAIRDISRPYINKNKVYKDVICSDCGATYAVRLDGED